jgi:hypothetical protein
VVLEFELVELVEVEAPAGPETAFIAKKNEGKTSGETCRCCNDAHVA